ncbi:MAG: gamma subclass chorismate mutase AroQ [Pseudomonadales bacterium]|nr:gamma subclass chorismate mutase AroQ [Pseudomonadales bacterium]
MIYRLLTLLLVTFSINTVAEITATEVFVSINERLGYMEDVALYKAHNHLAIEDISREVTVINKAKDSARSKGLNPDQLETFFKAQIAVAKAIQYRYRADLLSRPTLPAAKDLQKELRPSLLRLGDKIINQIALYTASHGSFSLVQFSDFDQVITGRYISQKDKQMIFRALQQTR